jgi:mRNA interferase HicA
MKRVDLSKHLRQHGCVVMRKGGNHTIYVNELTKKISAVPRHNEIKKYLVDKICKDLGIPKV